MIEQAYLHYRHLRNTQNPKEEQERLATKSVIARDISLGKGDWYLQRLQHGAYGRAASYGALAAQLSDTAFTSARREPSLAEATLATAALQAEYTGVKERLLPRVRSIIRVGSTTWAENFDVRNDPKNPSDLDLEVLVDPDQMRPDLFADFPAIAHDMPAFLTYYHQGRADYLASSYTHDTHPISIHVMPTTLFEANCRQDYFTHPTHKVLNEFRTKQKRSAPIYYQRNGSGKLYEYPITSQNVVGGQISQTPLMGVGDHGEVVMGLVMDKYFSQPKVDGDELFFTQNISLFKDNLARYLWQHGGSFENFPSRRERMPAWLIDQLQKEGEAYETPYAQS